ncbi:VanW family protein [Brevibacillus fluminis]|uniref:VanW family protein n=1 Tax=Brevibacillus fluminis TaxID=511487 RepID=UPI003F8A8129
MKLSQVHPIFYHARIKQKQLARRCSDLVRRTKFAESVSHALLPHSCKKHQSLLRRKLGNADPQLQENKIVNLKLAIERLDGLLIRPGETFSFWRRVGKPTRRRGFIEGMLLSQGKVITGVGGGLCQMANLLYWMALHTPLQISERHHHHFDPFPDDQRVLPFGSGASVFYNYVDLRFYNPTDQTFQLVVWMTDQHLKGRIVSDREWPYAYHIEERNHHFLREQDKTYRTNELWRHMVDKRTGKTVKVEHLMKNKAEVKYPVLFEEHANLAEDSGRT